MCGDVTQTNRPKTDNSTFLNKLIDDSAKITQTVQPVKIQRVFQLARLEKNWNKILLSPLCHQQ